MSGGSSGLVVGDDVVVGAALGDEVELAVAVEVADGHRVEILLQRPLLRGPGVARGDLGRHRDGLRRLEGAVAVASSTLTEPTLSRVLTITRSALPSALRSPARIDSGEAQVEVRGAWNVPSPLPRTTLIVLF